MAESARALLQSPNNIEVDITPSGADYSIDFPDGNQILNEGTVDFFCEKACWVWTYVGTTLTNVFTNEAGGHQLCNVNHNPIALTSAANGETITIIPTDPNAPQPDLDKHPHVVKGTIKVSSGLSHTSEAASGSAPAPVPINITFNTTTGYGINPPNSSAPNGGTIQFICAKDCWIWTFIGVTPTNVFVGETNYYVVCSAGGNNFFQLAATANNQTITIIPTDPNSGPPNPNLDIVKGTIKVSS
jgi:hypothetical protein